MTESVDQEVQAIRELLKALSPLSEKARLSVMDYVAKRFDLPITEGSSESTIGSTGTTLSPSHSGHGPTTTVTHIKEFKEQKKPRSANEMAAVVAYYLTNLASPDQRKNTVDQKDIETYFKIAEFPLPQQVRVTLQNAKAAGYFDAAGDGNYRLNAVGHNLVAHAMPRGKSASPGRKRVAKRSKRARKKHK